MTFRRILPLVATVLLGGCLSVDFIRINDEKVAPKPADCSMEIFSTKLPARDYIEIGILEGKGSAGAASLQELLPEMKRKACLAGGDAIILGGTQRTTTASGTVSPTTGGTVTTTHHLHTTATVIRWSE